MKADMLIHPGEILQEEFLEPHDLSASRLAEHIGVAPNRITGIINGARSITVETAVLFAHAFGTSPEFWLTLQTRYDLDRGKVKIPSKRIKGADALARELCL